MKHANCLHGEGDTCVFCSVTLHDGRCLICGGKSPILVMCDACAARVEHKHAPTFERCANATLKRVRATYGQRGNEYADSWATENLVTTFTAATLARFGLTLSAEQLRLLQAAALIDVKDSRMGGQFKPDSVIDGLAYRAAWLTLMEEYDV